jgi:hypothetical protein
MPNHGQVVTPGDSAEAVRQGMIAAVRGLRHSVAGRELRFEPVPLPTVIEDPQKLLRDLRYLGLNPSRAGLVADPLEWLWTSHRDAVGAVDDPWVDAARLAASLRWPMRGFIARYHGYVSADPSTRVEGTPLPHAAAAWGWPVVALGVIVLASAACHRCLPTDVHRRGPVRDTFLALARECGWRDTATLARVANLCPDAVRWHARRGEPPPTAAWLCLGDSRLLAPLRPALRGLAEGALISANPK